MLDALRARLSLAVAAATAAVAAAGGLLPGAGSVEHALGAASSGTRIHAAHSGQALDVFGASTAAGTPVIQWPANGDANQSWFFEPLGDGTYRIIAEHSGQVLDVAGASRAPGAPVIQWPWNGGPNQRWRIEDVPGEGSRIIAEHSGQALDVAGASRAPGAPVIQWPWNGGGNQRWLRIESGDAPVSLTRSCTHQDRGVTVTVRYPRGWHVNDPSVQPCSAFDPQPFSIEPGTEYPRDLAVVLRVEPVAYDQASTPTGLRLEGERSVTLDGRRAVRQEVVTTGQGLGPGGREATRYVVDAGPDRSIIASTYRIEGNDYGHSVAVLDAMARELAIDAVDNGDGGLDAGEVLAPGIDTGPEEGEASGPMVSVTDVRLGRHNGFDRVVFDIGGQGQAGWDVRYVDEARAAGSGAVVDVGGHAVLQVSLQHIALPPEAPPGVEPWDGPERLQLQGPGPVVEVVEGTLFEGVHTFFIGLTERVPFQVNRFDSPQRVVLDVAAP